MMRCKNGPGNFKHGDVSGQGGSVQVCCRRVTLLRGPRGIFGKVKDSILKCDYTVPVVSHLARCILIVIH